MTGDVEDVTVMNVDLRSISKSLTGRMKRQKINYITCLITLILSVRLLKYFIICYRWVNIVANQNVINGKSKEFRLVLDSVMPKTEP